MNKSTPLDEWIKATEAWAKANQYAIYRKGMFHDVVPVDKLPQYAALIRDLVVVLNPEVQTQASPEQIEAARDAGPALPQVMRQPELSKWVEDMSEWSQTQFEDVVRVSYLAALFSDTAINIDTEFRETKPVLPHGVEEVIRRIVENHCAHDPKNTPHDAAECADCAPIIADLCNLLAATKEQS